MSVKLFFIYSKMSAEYSDGIAFRYEMPKEDLALRGVCIEEGQPKLLFDVSKKVPTLTEQEVAMSIRVVHNDNERPAFSYCSFLPDHPFAVTGRHYKCYKPLYMRRTSMGENLAEIDWKMKCLSIGVRTDEKKQKFFSWPETSNVDGLKSYEYFQFEPSKPDGIFMKCKSVPIFEDSNQLLFPGEPEMMIDYKQCPGYSKYITDNFDSVAYFDEPLFLKMKEYIKLILAVEWLKEKNFNFSQNWLLEQTAPTHDPPKPLQVELSPEQRNSIIKRLKKDVKKAVETPELKQSLPISKYENRISVKDPVIKMDSRGFEATFERTIPDPVFESLCNLYVPVVQKVVVRATTHDFDFLYADIDPNKPVIMDPTATHMTPIRPNVKSWSELMAETEVFPCKWLQDPNNVMCRTPGLTGGVSTSSIPVKRKETPKSTASCIKVPATNSKNKMNVSSRDVPLQPVVNAPSSSAQVSTLGTAVATGGGSASKVYGFEASSSSSGMSKDGTKITQPSLSVRHTITQLVEGEEVGFSLDVNMQIPLPPKAESASSDSAYTSTCSTPSFHSRESSVIALDKDDSASTVSDSGLSSSATMDSDSNDTIISDDNA